ncbi:STAS domain-containing protein [Oxalobacter vibrioformis]|uniref:STAS domain-containing protein n=1 Tax=Oxalobacter vibrioformis TaxID=933080 RepID=A0A9E9LWU1_9BURK|nr:STAS domain-containing protein [Oxalobacter vibrioformis]WAW09070.1 STAS domain-containing protein [Oxalobacter vibrioformis]
MSVSITSLSFSSAKEALKTGLEAIKGGQTAFDLGSITTTDSSSIAVMLAWQRAAKAASTPLQFLNTPDNILSLAALYGVTDLLGLPAPVNAHGEATH